MLKITNRTNHPVFIGRLGIGVGKSVMVDENEYRKISSNVAILERNNIINIVTVENKEPVKQEVASLTSETAKKGRRKNKKEKES